MDLGERGGGGDLWERGGGGEPGRNGGTEFRMYCMRGEHVKTVKKKREKEKCINNIEL